MSDQSTGLQALLTPEVLANEVGMLREACDAVWVTQSQLGAGFIKYYKATKARIVFAGGHADAVVSLAKERNITNVLALVDVPPNVSLPAPPMFAPDEGDLDSMLLEAGLAAVLSSRDDVSDPFESARKMHADVLNLVLGPTPPIGPAEVCTGHWAQVRGAACVEHLEAELKLPLRERLWLAFRETKFVENGIFLRITEWELLNNTRALRELRERDPLGEVTDQRYWERAAAFLAGRANQTTPLALIKLDLDNFKITNKELGHTGGDQVIRDYCAIIRDTVGLRGDVYRRGGDEVVVLVPGINRLTATTLAERVRAGIEARFKNLKVTNAITASIGVLLLAESDESYAAVAAALDAVQQLAKDLGKNRVEVTEFISPVASKLAEQRA